MITLPSKPGRWRSLGNTLLSNKLSASFAQRVNSKNKMNQNTVKKNPSCCGAIFSGRFSHCKRVLLPYDSVGKCAGHFSQLSGNKKRRKNKGRKLFQAGHNLISRYEKNYLNFQLSSRTQDNSRWTSLCTPCRLRAYEHTRQQQQKTRNRRKNRKMGGKKSKTEKRNGKEQNRKEQKKNR